MIVRVSRFHAESTNNSVPIVNVASSPEITHIITETSSTVTRSPCAGYWPVSPSLSLCFSLRPSLSHSHVILERRCQRCPSKREDTAHRSTARVILPIKLHRTRLLGKEAATAACRAAGRRVGTPLWSGEGSSFTTLLPRSAAVHAPCRSCIITGSAPSDRPPLARYRPQ